MITKERLEELIEQEATIYYKEYGKIKDVTLDNSYYIDKFSEVSNIDVLCRGCCDFDDDKFRIIVTFLSELYETEEDAEFVLKYHTFRVEKFEPPTWEEFEKRKFYEFQGKNGRTYYIQHLTYCDLLVVYDNDDCYTNQLTGAVIDHTYENTNIFKETPTKENYIKAVEIARKLFLGESVV